MVALVDFVVVESWVENFFLLISSFFFRGRDLTELVLSAMEVRFFFVIRVFTYI